jgi:hypothetical protein
MLQKGKRRRRSTARVCGRQSPISPNINVSHLIDDFASTVDLLKTLQRGRTQRAARQAARQ